MCLITFCFQLSAVGYREKIPSTLNKQPHKGCHISQQMLTYVANVSRIRLHNAREQMLIMYLAFH